MSWSSTRGRYAIRLDDNETEVIYLKPASLVILRFSVGSRIECLTGSPSRWQAGLIIQLGYTEATWSSPVPYQIKLDNGRTVFVPKDLETYVRKSTLPIKQYYTKQRSSLSIFFDHAEADNVAKMRECLIEDPTLATQRELDGQGGTCLHIASWFGSLGAIQLLLESGADVNAKDYRRCQPLHLAARASCLEAAQLLLDAGASRIYVDFTSGTALHAAVESQFDSHPNASLDMIRLLVTSGFDTNATNEAGWSVLSLVCRVFVVADKRNFSEKMSDIFAKRIDLLVSELGANVNGNGNGKSVEVGANSLDKGMCQSVFCQLALYCVDLETKCKEEKKKKKGPSKSSTTNLKRAIKSMCLLVKHGANVDEINPHWNMTHVFWAVMNQCYKTTKCLLELGADANIPAGANKHPSLSKLQGKRISHIVGSGMKGFEKIKALFAQMKIKEYTQRFSFGDRVECSLNREGGTKEKKGKKKGKKKRKKNKLKDASSYQPGIVVKLDYKEKDFSSPVPYQVRLDNGEYIFVPYDTDIYIRKSNTTGPADYDVYSDPNLKKKEESSTSRTGPSRKKAPRKSRMGLDILNELAGNVSSAEKNKIKKKNKKKNKKKQNNKNKTIEGEREILPEVFVSDRAPNRVLDATPLFNSINLQQSDMNVSTTEVKNHTQPPDPVFAIEIPNLTAVGPPMDFLEYGGIRGLEILSMEIPTGCAVQRRPEMFNKVSTSWVEKSMLRWGNDKMQWLCGSTRYGCDICAEVAQHVVYHDAAEHGLTHQYDQIRLNRPTICILYGDPHAEEGSRDSKTSYVMWRIHKGIHIKVCDFQPDGSIYVEEAPMSNVNSQLLLRAFLCAADCLEIGTLSGLFRVANTAASRTGRIVEFAHAVDRLNVAAARKFYNNDCSCPGFDFHPYPETGFGYYAFQAGESHEAAANSLSEINDKEGEREQLRLAVASYKFGAYLSSQAGAESNSCEMRSRLWDCLGLAIRRYAATVMDDDGNHLVYFDMAERAYRWAVATLFPLSSLSVKNFNTTAQHVYKNLSLCMHYRNKNAKENLEAYSGGMKDQRKKARKDAAAGAMFRDGNNSNQLAHMSKHMCSQCSKATGKDGTKLKLCSRCKMVYFCSSACQRLAWPTHKQVCGSKHKEKKSVKISKKDL